MRRKDDRLAKLTPRKIVLGAAIWSFLASCATLAVVRFLKSRRTGTSREEVVRRMAEGTVSPIEHPNVLTGTPTTDAPPHFTEDIIVPGFTETGEQIMEQDAEHGRSPEGV